MLSHHTWNRNAKNGTAVRDFFFHAKRYVSAVDRLVCVSLTLDTSLA